MESGIPAAPVTAIAAVAALAAAVALIALLTGRLRVHPFLALLAASFSYGIAAGIPADQLATIVRAGFGGTLSGIGIVIVAGTLLGTVLEKTGATQTVAMAILRLTGMRKAPLAMSVAGCLVSIPVSCDSGYVILSPLGIAAARESGASATVLALALSTGLYAAHCLAPPTPGPLAASAALGADLGRVLLFGLAAAVPAAAAGLLWAIRVAPRIEAGTKPTPHVRGEGSRAGSVAAQARDGIARMSDHGPLPGLIPSMLPIVAPIILMILKSIADLPSRPLGSAGPYMAARFAGEPSTALLAGFALSLFLVPRAALPRALDSWVTKSLKDAAGILLIVAAGGAFGQVVRAGPLTDIVRAWATDTLVPLGRSGLPPALLLCFVLAAILKTAQGSSTVAILTASALLAPALRSSGLDPALAVIALGAGSMAVSHANDSYFWVVSQCSGMPPSLAWRVFSPATAVQAVAAFAAVALLSLVV